MNSNLIEQEFTRYFNLSVRYRKNCEAFKNFEITKAQGKILHFIFGQNQEGKKVFQKDIEKQFTIRRSTATEVLNKLENLGYVERVVSKQDARMKEILLTQKSIHMINQIHDHLESFFEQIGKNITENEANTLLKILRKINTNLENQIKEKNNV